MPTQLQFRRGTTAQNNAFTGAAGEISIDTDLNTMRVHDGSTAGGQTLPTLTATQTFTNKTLTSPTITGTGAIAGTFTGNITGDVTGNADTATTATALATARAIQVSGAVTGTANFDGSAAINIVTTNTADPTITLTGAVTGSGTLTNLGDVSIATTATADPTITLAGDLSGSATLTNLGSATLTATIAANSVALSTDTTGNYVQQGATSGNGISGSVNSEGGTFTVTSNATNANTGSTIVFRDSSGDFSAGVITATTTAARYADLAERYTADADYEPGTVLVFGGEAEVTQATNKYDKRIAGIVSTDPAFLMNESLEDGISVGLVGRLPCKVVGEIRKGDLMVSSATPGYAEAWRDESNPPAGSVIGKALENKTGASTDVIEVVVGRI
jgi:hypothetical protein